jgi:hypothetical protein
MEGWNKAQHSEIFNARLYAFWGSFTEALRTGRPQNEAKSGGSPFAAIYSTPEKLESFLGGMTGISLGAAMAIAEKFPWKNRRSFADIGAAQGAVPVQLALQHPHLQGIGYDLALVQPVFDKYVHANGVADRVRFQAGDFFKDPLPRAEVLIMGRILHDWNLEQKRALLAKAYAALPPDSALIVHEAIIDDDRRENAFGLLMGLNMLIETAEGFDYTGRDCRAGCTRPAFTKPGSSISSARIPWPSESSEDLRASEPRRRRGWDADCSVPPHKSRIVPPGFCSRATTISRVSR